jgi:hypothetical protein
MGARSRTAAVVATALAGVLLAGGVAEGAAPTTYTQYSCRLPSGAPAPTDGFRSTVVGIGAAAGDECGSGKYLWSQVPGATGGQTYVDWTYYSPPNTQIASLRVTRSSEGLHSGSNILYSYVGTSDVCDPTAGCQDISGTYTSTTPASSAVFELACPDSGCVGSGGQAGSLWISAVAVALQDQAPPTLTTPPAGGLFNTSAPVGGTAPIAFSATDKGGGVYQAAVVVDGVEKLRQVVDANNGDCKEPFVKRTPCKLSVNASLAFDTTQLPDGPHKVALVVYDATNVNSVTYGPVDITVDNRPRTAAGALGHVANGTPASAKARIVPAKPFRRKRIAVRFDRTRKVHGRLLDDAGHPIAGARLAVFLTGRTPGSRPRLIAGPLTDAAGRYVFRLPKHGTSGRLLVAYRTYSDDPGFATSWSADVDVPAPISLKPSRRHLRNGDTLALVARVRGRHLRARSADIAFQVLIGTQWRTFGVRPLDKHGRAHIGHTFRVTFQRLRYRFRALVLPRRTFPYRRAKSQTVGVLVN